MNDGAYALARARALRVVPVPTAEEGLSRLQGAVDDVERRLVEVAPVGGPGGLLIAWAHDVDPSGSSTGDGQTHREATPSLLLTLGACLRACWPDPDQPPYPGIAAVEKAVLAALVLPDEGPVRQGIAQHAPFNPFRRALRMLRACAWLEPDLHDGRVRLGPMVAAWTERDIDELRRSYPLLPSSVEE
ncbi:hypothetical protein [Streptomyces phaeochromogenes]|uniref:hypothetical protein n=1 Tax=Streptomyces phaeochromogenes TaxID=1923 RepID=UPI002DD82A59|nr:hypothetical protein [Streptomyces phaeochromogenes]WRZ34807.1 hypothetical protein OG931_47310 [Streptomyces phaeochromogenes]